MASGGQDKALSAALLAAAPTAAKKRLSQVPGLEDRLRALVAAGVAAWPEVRLEAERFVRHAARCLPASGDPATALETLRAADLYLACACACGDERALAIADRLLSQSARAARRIDPSPAFLEEVVQAVRNKLFLPGPEGLPRISEYAGRGPLAGYLRAAALRTALNLRRDDPARREAGDLAFSSLAGADASAEASLARTRHQGDFLAAFQEALAALTPRERNLLRLHVVEGVSGDEIGRHYGVHRTTVTRWVTRVRESVIEETRAILARRLRLRGGSARSLIPVLVSQLDFRISQVLGPEEG